jgi:hypothetical protein
MNIKQLQSLYLLDLGENVIMGENAYISWDKVTNQPTIPTVPSYIKSTYIDSTRIESPSIYGGTITIGSGNNVWKADSNGVYLGNTSFANAPFSVSMTGELKDLNGVFKGTIDGSTITGSMVRTAGTNAERLELSGNGLVSLNAAGEKNGVVIDSGNFSSVDFYFRDTYRGGLSQQGGDISLTTTMGSIIIHPSTFGRTVVRGEIDFTEANMKGITAVFA